MVNKQNAIEMVQIHRKKVEKQGGKVMLTFSIWEYRKLLLTEHIDSIRKEGHSSILIREWKKGVFMNMYRFTDLVAQCRSNFSFKSLCVFVVLSLLWQCRHTLE